MAKGRREWLGEANTKDPHEYGMCRNGRGGLGCHECVDEDIDDAYDNADLDDIPNVYCDVDWRKVVVD